MKIATFNINNVNRRLPNLLRWLRAAKPDVVALQELKSTDADFPIEAISKAGYGAVWRGQKTWNGVAILARNTEPVLIRLHSECFTGDFLGSLKCDCGDQLRGAVKAIAAAGGGVLLYLAQEGRGIGLMNKLRAYQLQDGGMDTVEANETLGFAADARDYEFSAQILKKLGATKIRLLSNNPEKVRQLENSGIRVVERVPCQPRVSKISRAYLKTKKRKMGHLLEGI